jgi:hypothetical protein
MKINGPLLIPDFGKAGFKPAKRIRFTDGNNDYQDQDTFNLNTSDFYLSSNLTGEPVLNLTNTFSGPATFQDTITFSSDATFTSNVNISGYLNATNISGKNMLVNGNFDIWQRGDLFYEMNDGDYFADRWQASIEGSPTGEITCLRHGGAPDNRTQHTVRVRVPGPQIVINADEAFLINQKIEGFNILPFGFGFGGNKPLAISFWTHTTLPGTYCVSLRNVNNDRSYIKEITLADETWEFHEFTLVADGVDGIGDWNLQNGIGANLGFALACGSNFHAPSTEEWLEGNYIATANQVNLLEDSNHYFHLARVQFELGEIATNFDFRFVEDELRLCQRYYAKTFRQAIQPHHNRNDFSGALRTYIQTDEEPVVVWSLPASMRAAPTGTLYGVHSLGTEGQWNFSDGTSLSNARVIQTSEDSMPIDNTQVANDTGLASQVYIHATADAEL